eukprot:64466_1
MFDRKYHYIKSHNLEYLSMPNQNHIVHLYDVNTNINTTINESDSDTDIYENNININNEILSHFKMESMASNNIFWYNLYHINDNDIIFDKNAFCIQLHLAQIYKKENKNNNKNKIHQQNGYHENKMWLFHKYELKNNLFLNIGIELNEENKKNFSEIFFYQSYQQRNNKYR